MIFISQLSYSQDVWLQNHFSPNSGCVLSNSELVNVLINNNSGSFIPSNSITVSYTIDAGPTTSELLGVNLASGATWNFTFGTNANLSACGPHAVKVWVNLATDPNPLNDTLNWIVQNDCIIVPGNVTNDAVVCSGINSDILNLVGWTNGSISNWQYSENAGFSWTNIVNTTTNHSYNNLTTSTQYRVILEGGFCLDDTSGIASITVDPQPVGGTINSSTTHCETSVSGTLNLVGSSGSINFWEYSDDGGAIWNPIANTTTSHMYSGLTTETWYRAQIEGDACADVYSDTAIISIDAVTVAGNLMSDATICEGNTVSLTLLGYFGNVLDWESSEDLAIWTPLGEFDGDHDSSPLTTTTYYRVHLQNGVCPDQYSDTVQITVDNLVVGGNINNSMTLCEIDATDTLVLVNYQGSNISWEQSNNNGISWIPASGINDSLIFVNLTDTVWYRVFIEGYACPDVYSDTAIITIWQDTDAGILGFASTICEGESVDLATLGSIGTGLFWESSEDLVVWNTIASDTLGQTVSPVVTTSYRVIVQNQGCVEDTTNLLEITVNPLPIVDAGVDVTITEFDTIQLFGSAGSSVMWSPVFNISDSSVSNPFVWPNITTTYLYEVTTPQGCTASDNITITVIPYIEPSINIRNVVTPNGDGYNDFWLITGIEDFPETEVHVFNIYGQEIYKNLDYQNDWDATFRGNKLPNGTYHYIVKIKDVDELYKGNLTILGNE